MVCLYFAFCTLHHQNKHFIYKYLLPRTFYSAFLAVTLSLHTIFFLPFLCVYVFRWCLHSFLFILYSATEFSPTLIMSPKYSWFEKKVLLPLFLFCDAYMINLIVCAYTYIYICVFWVKIVRGLGVMNVFTSAKIRLQTR